MNDPPARHDTAAFCRSYRQPAAFFPEGCNSKLWPAGNFSNDSVLYCLAVFGISVLTHPARNADMCHCEALVMQPTGHPPRNRQSAVGIVPVT